MDKIQGYDIQKEAMFEHGRGFALGYNPSAESPFAIWHYTIMSDGQKNFYDVTPCKGILTPEKEFEKFLSAYDYVYKIPKLAEGQKLPAMNYYRYYSTQQPVDIGTFPKSPGCIPIEIANYEKRMLVENSTIKAWGELIYQKPLTEKQVADYELKPAPNNPDMRQRVMEQTQALGKWEDSRNFSDRKRLTWFHPDFGSYVLKDFVTPEQLSERFEIMKEVQAMHRQKPSIAAQLQENTKQAKEHREPPAKKDGPNHEDR